MTISVVIVSYNVKEFLQQCILSLKKSLEGINSEVIIVDNDSVDGSPEMVRRNFPEVICIENRENRGFAYACNQGIDKSSGEFILLLNPDTMVREDSISIMINFFRSHADAGAAGCKILNADGTLQLACRRSFPTASIALPKLLGLSRIFPKSRIFGRYNLTYLDPDETTEVDAVSGSFLMFRSAVLNNTEMLDSNFFMYGEDLDFCFRIKQNGWKIYYVPDTKIIHYKGESTKLSSFDSFITFYRAMDIFVRKHFGKSYSLIFGLLVRIGIIFRGFLSLIGRSIKRHAVFMVDSLVLIIALLLTFILHPNPIPSYTFIVYMLAFYLILWLGTGYIIGIYDRNELSYSRALVASIVSLVASVLFHFVLKGALYSPHLIIWSFISIVILLPGWRIFILMLQRRRILSPTSFFSKALLSRRAVIAGSDKEGKRIAKKLQEHIEHGFEVLGFVDKEFVHGRIEGFPFLGVIEDLIEIVRINKANEIIFTTDSFSNDEILNIMDDIKSLRVNIKIVPEDLDFILGKSSVEKIEDIPLVAINYNIFHVSNRLSKRMVDIIFSFILTIVSPLVILYACLFGWILVKREFLGVESSKFKGYMFGRRNGKKKDRDLEYYPLVWSILKGDMSFVGSELLSANPNFRQLRCKPGLTGLFQLQINKQHNEMDKKNYEHYYMQNHSLFLDIEIIIKALLNI